MDIMDVCNSTTTGYRYILMIADYFTKWTEAVHFIFSKINNPTLSLIFWSGKLYFGLSCHSLSTVTKADNLRTASCTPCVFC